VTRLPLYGAFEPYSLVLRTMSLSPAHFSRTSDPGSGTGTVCRSTPLAAVNSAVFAPIPNASDNRTTTVQPFD